MTLNCTFCNIINKSEKAIIVFEDTDILAFKDIRPSAKTHILIVPKVHINNAKSLNPEDKHIADKLLLSGKKFCEDQGLKMDDVLMGYHWPPFNSINHLHLHLIHPKSDMGFLSRLIFKSGSPWFVTPEYVEKYLTKRLNCNI